MRTSALSSLFPLTVVQTIWAKPIGDQKALTLLDQPISSTNVSGATSPVVAVNGSESPGLLQRWYNSVKQRPFSYGILPAALLGGGGAALHYHHRQKQAPKAQQQTSDSDKENEEEEEDIAFDLDLRDEEEVVYDEPFNAAAWLRHNVAHLTRSQLDALKGRYNEGPQEAMTVKLFEEKVLAEYNDRLAMVKKGYGPFDETFPDGSVYTNADYMAVSLEAFLSRLRELPLPSEEQCTSEDIIQTMEKYRTALQVHRAYDNHAVTAQLKKFREKAPAACDRVFGACALFDAPNDPYDPSVIKS